MTPRMACSLIAACLAFAGPSHADPTGADAVERLTRAFANRYAVDFSADIDLVMVGASGQERVRTFRALSKVIDGKTHSIGRLIAPSYLRGMTLLTIEAAQRGHDAFIYLPSLRKVRRVSTAQRNDAFLGSDVTYEDLERRRVEDYRLGPAQPGMLGDEPVHTIRATRRAEGRDDSVIFVVADVDDAILETRDSRSDASVYRIVRIPRSGMQLHAGHILPTQMHVQHIATRSRTDVVFRNLRVRPDIDDRLFSLTTLEQESPLPGESP